MLKSLNAIESSAKPVVKIRESQIEIVVKGKSVNVPFDDIRACAESGRLWVFLHGKSVIVLKKDQMVLRDDAALRDWLKANLDTIFVEITFQV